MRRSVDPLAGIQWVDGSKLGDLDFADDVALLSVYSSPLSLGGKVSQLGGLGRFEPKEHRRRKDRATFVVGVLGGGIPIPIPSRLGGLAEGSKLLQSGSGRSPGRKRIWCTLELSENH